MYVHKNVVIDSYNLIFDQLDNDFTESAKM